MSVKPNCFVIMPFGEKVDVSGETLDFDNIYEYHHSPALKAAGLRPTRCDKMLEAGAIHRKMIEAIFEFDVVVADITSLNPNVFWELGVRHALRDRSTILLKRKGTQSPFNIFGLEAISYVSDNNREFQTFKDTLSRYVANMASSSKPDSLVRQILSNVQIVRKESPLKYSKIEYKLRGTANVIGIVTGDISNVCGIDIWVNSENTNMQMARFFEKSISGFIRYKGARWGDDNGVEDLIQDDLTHKMGKRRFLNPGEVIVTTAGELAQHNEVRQVFHVAAVQGAPGAHFQPVPNLEDCIKNVLEKADSPGLAEEKLTSVLFPLLGGGTAQGQPENIAPRLVSAAISYFRARTTKVQQVYFLAYTSREKSAFEQAFESMEGLVKAGSRGRRGEKI